MQDPKPTLIGLGDISYALSMIGEAQFFVIMIVIMIYNG